MSCNDAGGPAGPAEAMLRQHMPDAIFLGERRGEELAAIYASLDVFVHSGPYGDVRADAAGGRRQRAAGRHAGRRRAGSTWWRTG